MTLKPPGPYMEASSRMKAIADMADGISVNPDTHPKHYFRSGREIIRSAASYEEDGQTEQAYILYLRFLTIFMQKLRQHPNYRDIAPSERKLMSDFCKKILPQAEYLKKKLLEKFEKEHEEYLVQVEKLKNQAEKQRQKELEEERLRQEALGKSQGQASKLNPPASTFRPQSSDYVPNISGYSQPQPSAPPSYTNFYDNRLLEFNGGPENKPEPQQPSTSTGPPSSMPSVDRTTKPSRVVSPTSSGIRPLIIPQKLSETFLQYASSNTKRNVETCGLLTGKIRGKQLLVTDLIIPKQSGSSDTCNMMNEAEIFDLQDKFNLITLGWIHTHPSQSAFLSSVDMHTHYSYQVMMPEAIAVVCAPKHNQVGFFTLTQVGMEEIGRCQLAGFHPHPPNGIFTEASHYSLDRIELKVHDLR